MRQKPTCNICFKKFTRNGNMLRHMEDIHNIFQNSLRKKSVFPQTQSSNPSHFKFNGSSSVESQTPLTPLTPLERTWSRIGELLKVSNEYMKSLNILRQNNYLHGQIDFYQREVRELKENNWILPNVAIQGLSGYFCRRCLTFNFVYIQHIGYDKTMFSRHRCDPAKVITPKNISSMNLPDLWEAWDQYESAASQMLDRLNFLMPGKKYLIAEDQSSLFAFLESMMHPDVAKIFLGVPHRYFFHTVTKDMMSDWIKRVVANMGNKTSVGDFEIRDFLRRVVSTYAIFEIPADQGIKRILIKITT